MGALILGLRMDEEIAIGPNITIKRVPDHNGEPRIAIAAPKDVAIVRAGAQRNREKQKQELQQLARR